MAGQTDRDDIPFERGSGNVFADLGLPDADVALAKADLALQIATLVEESGWSREAVAAQLGLESAELVRVLRGDLMAMPLERFLGMLTRFGQDVEIAVVPATGERGSLAVRGAAD